MKANVERGKGFRGALDYAFGEAKDCEIVAGNMHGTTPRELATEFGLSWQARSGITKPVWHTSLSLPPGEHLTAERWNSVIGAFMEEMGLDQHQYIAVRHQDTDLDHVHIIASRIDLTGKVWAGQWEAKRAIEATQKIEKSHGLTVTRGLIVPDDDAVIEHQRQPKKNELERSIRTGEAPARMKLQEIIDTALDDAPDGMSIFAFMDRIEAAGVSIRANVAKTGKMNGFSFEIDGVAFKASQLGKKYGWGTLQKRGITYEQDRQSAELIDRANRAAAPASGERSRSPAGAAENLGIDGPSLREPQSGNRVVAESIDEGARAGADRTHRAGAEPIPEYRAGGESGLIDPLDEVAIRNSGRSERRDGWLNTGDYLADLAATLDSGPVAGGERSGDSPAVKKKREAWRQQAQALGAPQYRLTLIDRTSDKKPHNLGKRGKTERFWTAAEVDNKIPFLSRENALGRDVYVTPIDPHHHYFVVDDMTLETFSRLHLDRYAPCLVQESSKDNLQAILKVPKDETTKDEQKLANRLVQALNLKYGDPKFSGVIHPFRMAGFSNKKMGKGNAFTRIIEAAGQLCHRATQQLDQIRLQWTRKQAPTARVAPEKALPRPNTAPAPDAGRRDWQEAWNRHYGIAQKQGWQPNGSALDFRAAVELLEAGYQPDDVVSIMMAVPDVAERHPQTLDYASRTVDAACQKARLPEGPTTDREEPSDDGYRL